VRKYAAASETGQQPERSCPDGGFCHHGCPADPNAEPCFRTLWCAPFTSYDGGTPEKPGKWKDTDR
jgi:hypothetical protein